VRNLRKSIAIASFSASLLAALHATTSQFITLATNDPRLYQPVLKNGIAWTVVSVLLLVVFVGATQTRWRSAITLPIAICCIAWWTIFVRWPYVFA